MAEGQVKSVIGCVCEVVVLLIFKVLQVVEVKSGHILAIELELNVFPWRSLVGGDGLLCEGRLFADAIDFVLSLTAEELLGLSNDSDDRECRDF